jgi:hypothetical protein
MAEVEVCFELVLFGFLYVLETYVYVFRLAVALYYASQLRRDDGGLASHIDDSKARIVE